MTDQQAYINSAGASDAGRVRPANEDSFVAVDLTRDEKFKASFEWKNREIGKKGIMLAVADGMGGAQAGEIASRTAIEILADSLAVESGRRFDKIFLEDHIRAVNQEVRLLADDNPKLEGMGTTLTVVLIADGRALIGQIGDSRCYLLRERRLTRLTKDQSLVQAMVDAGMITSEEAEVSSQKNVILSAIGHESAIKPVISEIEIERGDTLLLCSDGLTNMVREEEIKGILCRSLSPQEMCRLFIELANKRGGTDNITVIAAQLFGKGIPAADEEAPVINQFPRELF